MALFDLKVIAITELDGNKYEFKIEPTTNNGIYRAIKHFINKKEISKYKPSEVLQGFQNAELLSLDVAK